MKKIKNKSDLSKRIWEIDFYRGIAIILIVMVHFLLNLKTIYGTDIFFVYRQLEYCI